MLDIIGFWSSVTVLSILALLVWLLLFRLISIAWVTKVTKGEATTVYTNFLSSMLSKVGLMYDRGPNWRLDEKHRYGWNDVILAVIIGCSTTFNFILLAGLNQNLVPIALISNISLTAGPYVSYVSVCIIGYFGTTYVAQKLYGLSKAISSLTKAKESKDV